MSERWEVNEEYKLFSIINSCKILSANVGHMKYLSVWCLRPLVCIIFLILYIQDPCPYSNVYGPVYFCQFSNVSDPVQFCQFNNVFDPVYFCPYSNVYSPVHFCQLAIFLILYMFVHMDECDVNVVDCEWIHNITNDK